MTNEADVIVVGGGPGGMAAALEAANNGSSVILLEADTQIGGNAARSTGYLAFQNFDMQTQEGIDDSAKIFVQDMAAEISRQTEKYGITFDEELAWLFSEESSDTYSWLCDLGFEFNRFLPRPKQHSVNRMVDVKDTAMFTYLFEKALTTAGVEVVTETRVRRLLVVNDSVAGVQTNTDTYIANRGVLLATGGYQANPEIRIKYQPEVMASTPYLGTKHDVGDGHIMGQAVGGDLINMTMIPPLIMVGSALVEESIAVNLEGERFHDEAGPYDYRVDQLAKQRDRLAWYIFDDRAFRNKKQLIDEMPEEPISAHTLEELAGKLGCDGHGLNTCVDEWNSLVASTETKDPKFGRVIFPDPRIGILEQPFHASRMVVGLNFPAGGFRVSGDMQVLNVYGEPIQNLFAVGDCTGGLGPVIGMGGMRITPALTLGRIAGRKIATGTNFKETRQGDVSKIPENQMRIPVVDEAD
ncbi:MAG: FAD-dependent oxidoreductase [Acidimicrobiales bacterium]|nr:FAD-dependent oxidoreductase [Acidimicrobiales bacterium]